MRFAPKLAASLALLCCCAPAFGGYAGFRVFTINHTLTGTANSTNFTVLISGTYAEFATTANGGKVQNTVSCGVNSITCPADLVFTSDAACSKSSGRLGVRIVHRRHGPDHRVGHRPHPLRHRRYIDFCLRRQPGHHHFSGRRPRAQPSIPIPKWFTIFRTEPRSAPTIRPRAHATQRRPTRPTAVTGEIGGGVHFNGSNQDAECSSFSWTGTSAVTVSFWNYVTSAEEQNSFAFTVGNSAATDPHRFAASVPWSSGTLFWDYGANSTGTGRVQRHLHAVI